MNQQYSSSASASHLLDPSAQEFHPTTPPLLQPPPLFLTTPTPLTAFFQPLPLHPPPPLPQLFLPYPPPPTTFIQYLPPPPALTTNAPSRTLLLTSIPPYATEHSIRAELEAFGEIRAVGMERAVFEGIVTVHFYDLRGAQTALREIRAQHFAAGCPVWAQFIDVLESVDDPLNHVGTIVVSNLHPSISDHTLKRIFQAFGPVKEVREEAPSKRRQKFLLEYYDVRHAARAAVEMNGKLIHGKQITVDFSCPRLMSDDQSIMLRRPSRVRNIICTITEDNPRSQRQQQQQQLCVARRPSHDINVVGADSMSSSGNVNAQSDTVLARKVAAVNKQPWVTAAGKVKKKRMMDLRYKIKEDLITAGSEDLIRKTTLMIKNIPNKYSQKLLLSLLDNHCAHCNDQIIRAGEGGGSCLSSYDFLYLPMDFNNKCNVGYGFVNMTSPEATVRLYKAFHRQSWEVFNSRKICEVTYARVQGLEALKEHFRNSKFPSGSDEIFPVYFEPPRDGRRQLTAPQPIYGLTTTGLSENGSSSSVGSDEQSNESSQGCVNEVFLELRVVGDVTEVEHKKGGFDGEANQVEEVK